LSWQTLPTGTVLINLPLTVLLNALHTLSLGQQGSVGPHLQSPAPPPPALTRAASDTVAAARSEEMYMTLLLQRGVYAMSDVGEEVVGGARGREGLRQWVLGRLLRDARTDTLVVPGRQHGRTLK
jgi:hypothetical protein